MSFRSTSVSIAIALLWPSLAFGVTLEEVLGSSRQHYPKIIESQQKIAAQKGRIQEATGAFDWELKQKNTSRVSGYYDGYASESQISRRLEESATRIYGGYRYAEGTFPIYEQQFVTRDRGEINLGAVVSLWRDRIIDEERFALADARLELQQKELELLLTQMSVQFDAMTGYIDWVAAGLAVGIAKDQLELAEARQKGLETRLSKGDIARIYLTENRQVILKRQTELANAKQKLTNAALKLELYYRNAEGEPIPLKETPPPASLPAASSLSLDKLDQEIERARGIRPDLIAIQLQQQRNSNELKLSENSLKPRVDLFVEGAQDMGTGASNLGGTEAKIGLTIAIPLQQNIGKGRVSQTQAEARQLEQRKRLLNDQIAMEIQLVANAYHTAHENMDLSRQEVEAAEALQKAERIRFEQGAADFFVLNLREERLAEARLKNIKAQADLWNAIAAYYMATLQSDKLGL